MHVARGFTIIEFTIAIAVAVLLGAVAISRYNTYLREQEFLAGGQDIANCLQRANAQVRTGATTSPPRFTRATIRYDATNTRVTCVVEPQSQTGNTTTLLLQGTPAEPTGEQFYIAPNTTLASGTVTRVVFGALENGVPLGYSVDGVAAKQPDDATNALTYVPFGRGFSFDATAPTLRINSPNTNKCGIIQMTNLGTPVRFEELSTCS